MFHLLGAADLPFPRLEPFLCCGDLSYVVGHVRCTADGVLVLSKEPHHLEHSIDLSSGFQMESLPRVSDLFEVMAFRDPGVGIHLIVCTDGDEWERYQTYILLTLCRLFSKYQCQQLNAPPPILACDRLEVLDDLGRFLRFFQQTCRLALYVHESSDWEYLLTECKVPFLDIIVAGEMVDVTEETLEQYHSMSYDVVWQSWDSSSSSSMSLDHVDRLVSIEYFNDFQNF